jgi:hypothetical protein
LEDLTFVVLAELAPAVGVAPARTAVAAKSAARTLFPRTSFVDGQITTAHIFSIERFDGRFGAFRAGHGDEGEPSRTARLSIQHQIDFSDGAMLRKQILKIVLGRFVGKISHI